MKDKKFSSYTLYAIGKIALVVIGIMIALQLDNWNEENANKELVIKSLNKLTDDLHLQNSMIDLQFEREKLVFKEANEAINSLKTNDIKTLEQKLNELKTRKTFVSIKVTYNNMRDSKLFTFMENEILRNSIIEYYQFLDYTQNVINNNNLFLIDGQFGNYILTNPLKLKMDNRGAINYKLDITDQERYQLVLNITERVGASISIDSVCNIAKDKTIKLLEDINDEVSVVNL